LFPSYGAELVDAAGNITVDSDAVQTVLEYIKRLAPYLPPDVYSWDNASNNRALVAGRSAFIVNPPSAWAQAVKDRPDIGSQCWHFPLPAGPKGRFTYYFPGSMGVWSFSSNKSAAFELIEWLSQREQAESICTANHGYEAPPFVSMSDFKVWENEGPPLGTLSNYPIKPSHHATATLPCAPAPMALRAQIEGRTIMPNMVAKVASGRSIEDAITWAKQELEGLRR
jgi:ABC-type glycerol-3-phosphate transport system substrate-binding protein